MPLATPVSPPVPSGFFTACCSPEFARAARDSPETFLEKCCAVGKTFPKLFLSAVEGALAEDASSHTKMDENVRRLLEGWLKARRLPPKPAAIVASTAVGFPAPTVGCTSLHKGGSAVPPHSSARQAALAEIERQSAGLPPALSAWAVGYSAGPHDGLPPRTADPRGVRFR